MFEKETQQLKTKTAPRNEKPLEEVSGLSGMAEGMFSATISGRTEQKDVYELTLESGEKILAFAALSCFFTPEPQDRILAAREDHGRYLILSIVERPSELPLQIMADRPLWLGATQLTLSAENLTLRAQELNQEGKIIRTHAERLETLAKDALYTTDTLGFFSRQVNSSMDFLTSKVNTLMEKLGLVSRSVEGLETSNIHTKQERVQHHLNLQAGTIQINAKEHFQISSRQIFMS